MYLKYKIRELNYFIRALSWNRFFSIVAGFVSGKLSILTSQPIVWGLPFACSIEPTTRCNLRCLECPTGLGLIKREKGDMSLADFKEKVNSISSHTSYLTLYLQGEPFLNKDLSAMINYASQLKIFTCLSTNGHFLTITSSEGIISAGLKKIIISLDGVNQKTYEQYRQKGNFEKVIEGIKTLVETRKKSRAANPLIVIQFIVFRTNEHEIDDIKKFGKTLGVDKVEIKTAQHYDLTGDNNLITSIDKYNRYKKNKKGNWELKSFSEKGCARLWTTSVITWDGKLTACCYDKDAAFTFGNIDKENFKRIWRSEKFMSFRRTILKDKKSIAMCDNCGEK